MAILNYTTKIGCEQTIGEIQKILVKHGAHKITTDYANNKPSAVTFCLTISGNLVAFSLPANYAGVLRAMKKSGVRKDKCTEEHAIRVSWRIIKDWVEAQMAIVEAELADVAEVFLPYAITQSGNTLYEAMKKDSKMLLLN